MLTQRLFGTAITTEMLFGELIVAAVIVVVSGARFTRLADTLAGRLNLASGLVGLILLATVTSLPELVTGGTATWIGNVNLGLGAILGSCCFNITLIFLINALWGGGSILRGHRTSHGLTSSFGLALIALALLGIVLLEKFEGRPRFAAVAEWVWVGLILVTYFGCMKLTYRHERRLVAADEATEAKRRAGFSLWSQIALMAMILVVASWWLAKLGDVLSTHKIEMIGRPLGATFVGACFLALATSLPEIVTSVAAVRLGNIDMALGNIFGSNMFNIAVIPVLKCVSFARGDSRMLTGQAIAGADHLIVGLLAIVLTAIAVGGLAYKSERRLFGRFGFDSLLIVVTYLGGMTLLLMDGK